ncbi:MAG: hypothetical protein GTN69_10590 [Armatimonadetes bacterium]|nr:hypothetical protein [Armatimonadota bacterium]
MKRRRLSPVILKRDSRRPEVWMLQEALNALGYDCGTPDGWWGGKTTVAVTEFQADVFGAANTDQLVGPGTWSQLLARTEAETDYRPPLARRIQTVIGYYENSTATNAYGGTSRLNDGAGWNYGVMQHNGYGSLNALLRMAGKDELQRIYRAGGRDTFQPAIRDWMGSVEGIAAQDRYFRDKTLKLARSFATELQSVTDFFEQAHLLPYYERYLLIMVGAAVQNGALLSPYRKPFWRSIEPHESQLEKYVELYRGHRFNQLFMSENFTYSDLKRIWTEIEKTGVDRREVNKRALARVLRDHIRDPLNKLIMIAQWRARSSSPRWWTDVESRQMLAATGEGRVHGSRMLSLVDDFGFTDVEAHQWAWSNDGKAAWEGDTEAAE